MAMDLEQIERLQAEWKSLQPLPAELDKKLWEKLRLEWNYNSNHIEGNTLTYKETEMYLLRGQTSGVHVEREYVEMKGHDYAIEIVRDLARSPEELTEADIRNLNQVILKQSFYKDAITPDGKPARKEIVPGRYKLEPNSVVLENGEVFKYADPMEVPALMAKFVKSFRKGASKEGLEFLVTLAVTHHEFALIHPFDDGNGRVARLLTNYMLLRKSLLPIVVPSVKKKDYLSALEQADAGDSGLLADFFAEQLSWSLELGIKAAKGERLEEPSDVEKEIAILVRRKEAEMRRPPKPATITADDLQRVWDKSLRPLASKLSEKIQEIGKLFSRRSVQISFEHGPILGFDERMAGELKIPAYTRGITIAVVLKGYRHLPRNRFDILPHVAVTFSEEGYKLSRGGPQILAKAYDDDISTEERDEIVSTLLKGIVRTIKAKEAQQK